MSTHLFIFEGLFFAINVVLVLFLIALVLAKGKKDTATFALIGLYSGIIVYAVSNVLGSSVVNHDLSRRIFMFNMVDFLLPVFTAHCVLAFLGQEKKRLPVILAAYAIAISCIVFFLFHPLLFLQESVSKLYLPNYYQPGPYYWVMLLFFFSLTLYFLFVMLGAYRAANGIEKNRIKYFLLAWLLGYTDGSLGFVLVYNIPLDPLWSAPLTILFAIPFTYAALKYELMDIRLVIRRALFYSVGIGLSTASLVVLILLNDALVRMVPQMQFWTIPLVASILAFVIGRVFWRQSRESDRLKYEFITVAAHKLRTPLTRIRWEVSNLAEKEASPEIKQGLNRIAEDSRKIIELTNLLLDSAQINSESYRYRHDPVDLAALTQGVLDTLKQDIENKKLSVTVSMGEGAGVVLGDANRLSSVIEILVNNAISYTPGGGSVQIAALKKGGTVVFSVQDSGIGISAQDKRHIFTKFFRSEKAKTAETEGVGLGLWSAENIIRAHHGALEFSSEGEGKGSRFWFSLPA